MTTQPDANQLLLLEAALSDGDAAVEAWNAWRDAAGGLDNHDAASYRVLPLVYLNLAAAGVDDHDLLRLKGIYRHTWTSNQRLLHLTAQVLSALENAGVPTIALEAALLQRHYRDMGARPLARVTVIVPRRRRRKALALRAAAPVDIRVNDDLGLWERTVPLDVGGIRTRAPGDADQLLHAMLDAPDPVARVADSVKVTRGGCVDWAVVAARYSSSPSMYRRWSTRVTTPIPRKKIFFERG